MPPAEILRACLERNSEAAWAQFVHCFQPLIASSIARVLRRHGPPSPALIDDLVQETYLRLCRDDCRSLREFEVRHEDAIYGYLKVVATSVALDHYRGRAAHKRRDEVPNDGGFREAEVSSSGIEQSVLINELDRHLSLTESDRDRSIFWLYYRQGYSAKDIAAISTLGLTVKGVESCIYRLTRALRGITGNRRSQVEKENPTQYTLGEVK